MKYLLTLFACCCFLSVFAQPSALVFEEEVYQFESVAEGDTVTHTFTFTNKSKKPLSIYYIDTGCGCTAADYPLEDIAPNTTESVKITFDTHNKIGTQEKHIEIHTNLGKKVLTMKGLVYPKGRDY